jgi:hypothetical protein
VPTLADRGVSPGQRGGPPKAVNLSFLDRSTHIDVPIFITSIYIGAIYVLMSWTKEEKPYEFYFVYSRTGN